MGVITNTLVAVITAQEDNTNNVVINRGTGNPAVDCTAAQFSEVFKMLLAATDYQLPVPSTAVVPANICDCIYIKNNDPTAVVTVKWTPIGGGEASIINLQANGGQIILWQPATGAGAGNIKVRTNVAGSSVEFFVGII